MTLPGMVLRAVGATVSKTGKTPCPPEAYLLIKETRQMKDSPVIDEEKGERVVEILGS